MVPDVMDSQTSVEQRIANVQSADSADALLSAVEHLAEAKHPSATACLLEILGFNNPGAAVAAVDGLIAIGEPAVEPILASLGPTTTARGHGRFVPSPGLLTLVALRCSSGPWRRILDLPFGALRRRASGGLI